ARACSRATSSCASPASASTRRRICATRSPPAPPATPSRSSTCARTGCARCRPSSAPGPEMTLTELLGRRAATDPGAQYFNVYDEMISYGRLWAESLRYATGLARAGVGAGDKVCLIYPTCAEFFYTFVGALRLGAIPVPLYPTLSAEAAGLTRGDRVVSWLPLYHDMGLIGCAFTPPLLGAPVWLLPPDLRNPRHWLELVTQIGASFTVSPDFGYRNCVRNIHDPTGLD